MDDIQQIEGDRLMSSLAIKGSKGKKGEKEKKRGGGEGEREVSNLNPWSSIRIIRVIELIFIAITVVILGHLWLHF